MQDKTSRLPEQIIGDGTPGDDYRTKIFLITLLGIGLRIILLVTLPHQAFYESDHLAFWSWSRDSVENGLFTCYRHDRDALRFPYGGSVSVPVEGVVKGPDGRIHHPGETVTLPSKMWQGRPIDYPPLTAYVVHIQGLVHRILDPAMEPLTLPSWLILEIPTYIFEWCLAMGCLYVVRRWKGKRPGFNAFLLMWFCPGLVLAGILWAQKDAWFLAPAVWCVYFCMKKWWAIAGILWACACLMKGQSLFMVLALAYFFATRDSIKPFVVYLSAAALTVLAITGPFMFHTGLAWIQDTYFINFSGQRLPYTTLEALNLWMLDLVLWHRDPSLNSTILGITKHTYGVLFVAIALVMSTVICWRRYGRHEMSLLQLSALTYATIFLFSTEVCERYVLYFIPFLLISACIEGCTWMPFFAYSIIAIFEMTSRITLPPCLDLEHASFGGLAALTVLSSASLCFFVVWTKRVWGDDGRYDGELDGVSGRSSPDPSPNKNRSLQDLGKN